MVASPAPPRKLISPVLLFTPAIVPTTPATSRTAISLISPAPLESPEAPPSLSISGLTYFFVLIFAASNSFSPLFFLEAVLSVFEIGVVVEVGFSTLAFSKKNGSRELILSEEIVTPVNPVGSYPSKFCVTKMSYDPG